MIDLIIPAYNAHKYIENALYSVLYQNIHDKINVYIIDDHSTENYHKIVKKFKRYLNIKEYRTKKNMGPGYARQYGIDKSKAKYIMFLDADDVLFNCFAVDRLYKFISKNNYNAVSGYFVEEIAGKEVLHVHDTIWLHGKIYSRKFLKDNKIRFTNTYSNEDTGFNKLIYMINGFEELKYYTYVWKDNRSSLTRKDKYAFSLTGINEYIENICFAIQNAEAKKANPEKISEVIFDAILETYYKYIIYKDDTIIDNLKKLKEKYLEYKKIIPNNKKITIFNEKQQKMINIYGIDKIINCKITFVDFLKLI